nr:MAG: wsv308-like protein [Metapenaeopsis lamellata majanivirus]
MASSPKQRKRTRETNNFLLQDSYHKQTPIWVSSTRDTYSSDTLLFESRLETFMKKIIERQIALSLQNAMDISDIISPKIGLTSDILKTQIIHSSIDPSQYIDNLLKFLKGQDIGSAMKNNLIMSSMQTNRQKAVDYIKRCVRKNITKGIIQYDVFKACIDVQTNDESDNYTNHYLRRNHGINKIYKINKDVTAEEEGEENINSVIELSDEDKRESIVENILQKLLLYFPNKDNKNILKKKIINICKNANNLLAEGEVLFEDDITKITPYDNMSNTFMEELLIEMDNIVNYNYTMKENQLTSKDDIDIFKRFVFYILEYKTTNLVYWYKMFLAFSISYLDDSKENIKIYINKTHTLGHYQTVKDKTFNFTPIKLNDRIFLLSFLSLTLGPSLDILINSGNDSYHAAIKFIDESNADEKLSLKIKQIYDQLESRLLFLQERERENTLNTFVKYVTENKETDYLLQPLHDIICDFGNIIDILIVNFRDLILNTINIINMAKQML